MALCGSYMRQHGLTHWRELDRELEAERTSHVIFASLHTFESLSPPSGPSLVPDYTSHRHVEASRESLCLSSEARALSLSGPPLPSGARDAS